MKAGNRAQTFASSWGGNYRYTHQWQMAWTRPFFLLFVNTVQNCKSLSRIIDKDHVEDNLLVLNQILFLSELLQKRTDLDCATFRSADSDGKYC